MAVLTTNNRAVLQQGVGSAKVEIKDKPVPTNEELGDHKVLVKVHTWAINPCDYMLQDRDMVTYPLVLGCDVAGTVEAVAAGSSAASKFRVGDRVFGFTANNGFQDYVALEDKLMAQVPGHMTFSEASVFGLASAISALYLFGEEYLNLDYPKLGTPKNGKSVLIWGGGSAVGGNAIQLVTAAGYDVITTCSKRNFDYVKDLGAVQAFDYNDSDVTEKVAAALDEGQCAGVFMAAGLDDGNLAACKVAAASKQRLKFASSNYIANFDILPKGDYDIKQLRPGQYKPFPDCWFETIDATFGRYLPEALAKRVYQIAPYPVVVNKKGLNGIQEAVDLMRIVSEQGRQGIKEAFARIKGGKQEDEVPAIKLVVEL